MFRPRVLGTSLVVRQKRQRAYDLAERRKGFPIHLLLFLAGQRTELRRPGGIVAGSLMLNESYEILQKLAISRRRPAAGFVQRSYSDLEPERSLNFLLPPARDGVGILVNDPLLREGIEHRRYRQLRTRAAPLRGFRSMPIR